MTHTATVPHTPTASQVPARAIPILLYHSVTEEVSRPFRRWSVTPERFAQQLNYLHTHRYTPLTVSQLVRRTRGEGALPQKPVVITFDDGFADVYTHALPLLKHYGFCATLYITTDYVGKTSRWLASSGEGKRPMLTWAQVRELAASGVECGAHTRSHPQLDTLSVNAAQGEITGSKRALEHHLGSAVESFAYPYGYHSAAVKELVRQAGFSSACAVKHALSAPHDDPFALARAIVSADTDLIGFQRLLSTQGLPLAPLRESWQTVGWRLARRSLTTLRAYKSVALKTQKKEVT